MNDAVNDPDAMPTSAPDAMSASELRVHAVTVRAGRHTLVGDISLRAGSGEVIGLVGPNGSGKSSLLRAVYRVLRPAGGTVWIDDRDIWRLPVRDVAKQVAAVTQDQVGDFDLLVRDVVAMGRTPHKRMLDGDTETDAEIVATALRRTDTAQLADRTFAGLSGGERQRVLIARALTQQPRLLVLDEPTNHLDIRHQLEVLGLLRQLPSTALIALHDLNLAAYYCDRLYVLHEGRLAAQGTPAEVLTAELLAEVYEVESEIGTHPRTGAPQVTFLPPTR